MMIAVTARGLMPADGASPTKTQSTRCGCIVIMLVILRMPGQDKRRWNARMIKFVAR
jgi:hypothetical protein